MKNFYIVISATSRNAADAIAEAHRLTQCDGHDYDAVEVRECGTRRLVAQVWVDGQVALGKDVPSVWAPGADERDEVARKLVSARVWAEARRKDAQRETERRAARQPRFHGRTGDPHE